MTTNTEESKDKAYEKVSVEPLPEEVLHKYLVAVDSSKSSHSAVKWVLHTLVRQGKMGVLNEVILVSYLPAVSDTVEITSEWQKGKEKLLTGLKGFQELFAKINVCTTPVLFMNSSCEEKTNEK